MIKHLAVIMDGNRRWATSRGLNTMLGHREGAKAVDHAINFCLNSGISYLSLYTFSLENFQRSRTEKEYLFDLVVQELESKLDFFIEKEVRVRFVGDRNLFPAHVLPTCQRVEQATARFTKLSLNLLFCYGARQEILEGVKRLVHKVTTGELSEKDLTDQDFEECLWSAGVPEPDLIIRTGGRQRLSNFLLYQAAYSEVCFLDCLWPDMTVEHFQAVLNNFENQTRSFGI